MDYIEASDKKYLTFSLGEKKYALKAQNVLEIIKLPTLEYPQKLPNNILGLLKYNNFTLNIFDLRFYLELDVTPYSASCQILIVKTDEAIFGLIADSADDIIEIGLDFEEHLNYNFDNKIIDFVYVKNGETLTTINVEEFPDYTKKNLHLPEVNVLELFPKDEASQLGFKTQLSRLNSRADIMHNSAAPSQFLGFNLGDFNFCINSKYIKEVIKNPSLTKVPASSGKILGIISIMDEFIPVINLKGLLQLTCVQHKAKKIIVLSYLDCDFAIAVDGISTDFMDLEHALESSKKYVENDFLVHDKIYSLLDLDQIVQNEILKLT